MASAKSSAKSALSGSEPYEIIPISLRMSDNSLESFDFCSPVSRRLATFISRAVRFDLSTRLVASNCFDLSLDSAANWFAFPARSIASPDCLLIMATSLSDLAASPNSIAKPKTSKTQNDFFSHASFPLALFHSNVISPATPTSTRTMPGCLLTNSQTNNETDEIKLIDQKVSSVSDA